MTDAVATKVYLLKETVSQGESMKIGNILDDYYRRTYSIENDS
jgi:hypothetical protein